MALVDTVFARRIAALLGLVALAIGLAGCASVPTKPSMTDEQVNEIFQKAEAYYRNHFYDKALALYVQVYEADPKGGFADNALYKIAGTHMRRNEPEKAVVYFGRLQSEFPESPYAEESLYNLGYCYFQMGDAQRAFDTYRIYLARNSARNKNRARALAAQSLVKLGRAEEAIGYWATAAQSETDAGQVVEILQQVKDTVDREIPGDRLVQVVGDAPEGVVRDYLRYRAGQDAASAGRIDEARTMFGAIDFRRAKYRFYQQARDAQAALGRASGSKPTVTVVSPEERGRDVNLPRPASDKIVIGVVLPLSGPLSIYGDQALHGILVGVDRFGDSPGVPRIEVVIRDSEGDGETAARRVTELAADARVVAVIGALLVKEAEATAAAAEEHEIPLIALSRKEDLLDGKAWVVRNAVTFADQARALIRYAKTYQGAGSFGVMHPENEFGQAFADAFEQALAEEGLGAVVTTSYPEKTTDWRAQARRVLGAKPDALFIPDNADRVALLAPQLVYFGVKDITLLGPSSWNQDDLAKKAGAYLRRAAIADGFFARAADANVQNFVGLYADKFAEMPTLLSALGYDSVGLVARVAASGSTDSRAALRRGLSLIHAWSGATGDTSINAAGECRKSLYILRVGDDAIEEMY